MNAIASSDPGVFLTRMCLGGKAAYALLDADGVRPIGDHARRLLIWSDAGPLRHRRPQNIFGIGANHPGAADAKPEPSPFFSKSASALVGPNASVAIPRGFDNLIAEAELVAVLGATLERADLVDAEAAIAGYAIGNDLTALPVSMATLFAAKASRGLAPIGRRLLPSDLGSVELELWVNGDRVGAGATGDLYLRPAAVVAELSHVTTLRPGDLVFTGAVAVSAPLTHGDRVAIEAVGFERVETVIV